MSEEFNVYCEKCGAEITTGLMAVFCPKKQECEFWPQDVESQKFILDLRADQREVTK